MSQILIQENQDMKREEKILYFIQENPGCTKTKVINYMDENGSSQNTSYKILKRLVDEDKKVVSQPDRANSRIHHLYVNDKSEFIRIKKELSIIKSIMDMMDDPIQKTLHFSNVKRSMSYESLMKSLENRNQKYTNYSDLYDHFIYPYEEAVTLKLQILFDRISKKTLIISEEDSRLLHTKIANLMLRLKVQIFNITKEREYLDYTILELKQFRLPSTEKFSKNNHIDIKLRENIIEVIKDFEENFLS